MHSESAQRRLHPRIIDCDWLVLREMRFAIEKIAARVAEGGNVAIDLGCGSQPYRSIFDSRGLHYRGADFGSADILIHQNAHDDAG